jgi:endonuclease/exonuclease/phosphatase family protein
MNFRFVSWNVRNIGGGVEGDRLVSLIEKQKPDLVALQEVNPKFHVRLASAGNFAWSACSLTLRRPSAGEPSDRKRGCSIFGRGPFVLSWLSLLNDVWCPEQTLVADLHCPAGPLVACSFHTPPGASHGDKKSRFLRAIAEWLALREFRTVFGVDANAPKTDHPNITQNEWWRPGEPELLGSPQGKAPRRLHKLEDTFRTYLAANPDEMSKTQSERPNGPLAVSYDRGHKGKKALCRYDFIYATPDISAKRVSYLYSESRDAGSDHGMVMADLEFLA